ncbi:hypothetical protein BJ742DRAFT_743195 [Cladochytrium replicatum]|nr:hypothetical protein BJ742DRAFT_743195 [Cladochytrium replicatum]
MTSSKTKSDYFDLFRWSKRRKSFENFWHNSELDHYWERKLGHACTAGELQIQNMLGHYHTTDKPRLLLDTEKREVVAGDGLQTSIKYLVVSHGWPQNSDHMGKGVVLQGMYWVQDCIDEPALDCIVEDAKLLGFRYVWVDALCTPQKDDFDIDDTNRMGEYYLECASCLVYLDKIGVDVTPDRVAQGQLPWFSRYWTLQEAWLPYQCLFKLKQDDKTFFATDYNFFWLIAASPRLGEMSTLQRGFELLGNNWWPTLSNLDRQLADRTGHSKLAAIYSILHLARPFFTDPDAQAPRETDVVVLARWFVAQLKDPSQLVNCPTILSLFGDSREYAWLRSAPSLPISTYESEFVDHEVIWPSDPSQPLGLRQSREYGNSPALSNVSDLWDYMVARALMRAMVRKEGGGNTFGEGLRTKLQKFNAAGCPSGHTIETTLDGFVPERLALVSTHRRRVKDPTFVVRELVLVKASDEPELYHCIGWRESVLASVPFYRKRTIFVAEVMEE